MRIFPLLTVTCMAVFALVFTGCGTLDTSGGGHVSYSVYYGYHGPDLWDYYPPPYYHRPGHRPERPIRPLRPEKPVYKPIPKPPPDFGKPRPPGGPSIQPVPKPSPKPIPRPMPRPRPRPMPRVRRR